MRLRKYNRMREDLYERISNYVNVLDKNNIEDIAKEIRKDFKLEIDYYDCNEDMIHNIIMSMLELAYYLIEDKYLYNKES